MLILEKQANFNGDFLKLLQAFKWLGGLVKIAGLDLVDLGQGLKFSFSNKL